MPFTPSSSSGWQEIVESVGNVEQQLRDADRRQGRTLPCAIVGAAPAVASVLVTLLVGAFG